MVELAAISSLVACSYGPTMPLTLITSNLASLLIIPAVCNLLARGGIVSGKLLRMLHMS